MEHNDCIQRENITALQVMFQNTMQQMKENNAKTQDFIDKYFEKDKPLLEDAAGFIKTWRKVFWIIATPLIAGVGGGIIIVGFFIFHAGGK